MECGFIIEDEDVTIYKYQLEEILPGEIDGIVSESGLMIRYHYLPNTVRLVHLIDNVEFDPLTPYWSLWSYQVMQTQVMSDEKQQVGDIQFFRPVILDGYVEIPVDPSRALITEGIDFVQGLETSTEGYW